MLTKILRCSFVAIAFLTLTACGEPASKKLPEQVATEFIKAIYNDNDLKTIKLLSTSKLKGIIGHYSSVKMIQRHVMDLSLDKANVEVTDVGGDFFRKSRKDLTVELHINGKYNGGFVADDRFLLMTFENGIWKVKRIKKS